MQDYKRDVEGFTVVSSIHVEVVWPEDPVEETRYVWNRSMHCVKRKVEFVEIYLGEDERY